MMLRPVRGIWNLSLLYLNINFHLSLRPVCVMYHQNEYSPYNFKQTKSIFRAFILKNV
jgi:hypothetical protein